MIVHSRLLIGVLALTLATSGAAAYRQESGVTDIPSRLTDQEFWRLVEDSSEPDGSFPSDNLLSNELLFAQLLPELVERTQAAGVYLGVGPEQNFTYIAAVKPRIAFITDIRRGNLRLQLMYKALFELSTDRADFVARLFTKKRPAGLMSTSSARELMDAFWSTPTADDAAFDANLKAVSDLLIKTHSLPLSASDLDGIAHVYRAFYWYGPGMNPASDLSLRIDGQGSAAPTYRDVIIEADANGHGLSYLSSEDQFAFVRDLQRRNLIVPIVGDFSGSRALRAIGRYLKDHRATVSVFYLSNVESSLRRAGSWPAFCANVASMPLNEGSIFIRVVSTSMTMYPRGVLRPIGQSKASILPIAATVKNCSGGLAHLIGPVN